MPFQSKQKLTRDKFLTERETKLLLKMPDRRSKTGARDYAILMMFLHTGLRKAELLKLDVSDLRNDAGRYYLRVHSKGGNIDEQPIEDPATLTAMRAYFEMWSHGSAESAPLFISSRNSNPGSGGRLSRTSCDMLVKKYASLANLRKNVHPHTLRHTFASAFAAHNKDIVLTREVMRHKSIATTSIYTHAEEDEVRQGLKGLKF